MSSPVAADAASNGTPIHHTVSRPVRATPAQVFAGLRDFQLHPTKYLNTASDAVIIENTKEHIKRKMKVAVGPGMTIEVAELCTWDEKTLTARNTTVDDPFRSGHIDMHVFPLHGGGSELRFSYRWHLSAAAPPPMVASLKEAVPNIGSTHINNFVAVIEKEQGGVEPSTLLSHNEVITVKATADQAFKGVEAFFASPQKYIGASDVVISENTKDHVKRGFNVATPNGPIPVKEWVTWNTEAKTARTTCIEDPFRIGFIDMSLTPSATAGAVDLHFEYRWSFAAAAPKPMVDQLIVAVPHIANGHIATFAKVIEEEFTK